MSCNYQLGYLTIKIWITVAILLKRLRCRSLSRKTYATLAIREYCRVSHPKLTIWPGRGDGAGPPGER